MLRKFLAIGYTELRYQGGACGIEAHLPVREVTHRCDEQYPMGGVRQFVPQRPRHYLQAAPQP